MAQHIKQEMPNMNGTEEAKVYYRLNTCLNINSKEFVKRITDGLAGLLGNGYSVPLDGVEFFKPSLKLKKR